MDHVINRDIGKFDWIFGPGSAKVISDVIGCCFIMPTGCKVGLIDEYHIWCFLMGSVRQASIRGLAQRILAGEKT